MKINWAPTATLPWYVIARSGSSRTKLLGIEPKVRQQQQHATQAEANRLSVKMELQADCFAGVWGHNMQQQDILETGDLQEALNAAEAIGDDRLQQSQDAWCRTVLPTAPRNSATPVQTRFR